MIKLVTALTLSLMCLASTSRADIYIGGHADIGVAFETDHLHLHLHAEDVISLYGGGTAAAGEYNPGDLEIGVPGPSVSRPAGATWNFLAPNADNAFWFLPQSTDPNKPFLGLGLEDLTDAGWSTITWQFNSITSVSGGPSAFSLFQTDVFGNPVVKSSSLSPTLDGNSWTQIAGGHDHYNWAFTSEGVYDVSFTVSGINGAGDAIADGLYTDTATFRFVVGSAITAVPEPSAFLLTGMSLAGLGLWRRRRNLVVECDLTTDCRRNR